MDASEGGAGRRVGGREVGEELGSSEAGARILESRSDFGERDKDEGSLGEAGVRDFEVELRKDEVVVEEEIKVEGAGAVGEGGGAVTAEAALDGEKSVKERARCEIGFKGNDGVEEAGLIGKADGRGGVERGAGGDAAE